MKLQECKSQNITKLMPVHNANAVGRKCSYISVLLLLVLAIAACVR